MIADLIVAALACAALYVVVAPLRSHPEATAHQTDEMDLLDDKERSLTALIELEEDRMVGKLSEDDFARLRRRYEAEALETLRRLNETVAPPGDPLEAEIAAARAELAAATGPEGLPCAQCGGILDPDGVCTGCGAR